MIALRKSLTTHTVLFLFFFYFFFFANYYFYKKVGSMKWKWERFNWWYHGRWIIITWEIYGSSAQWANYIMNDIKFGNSNYQTMYQPLSRHMHERFVTYQKGENEGSFWVICDLQWILNEKNAELNNINICGTTIVQT